MASVPATNLFSDQPNCLHPYLIPVPLLGQELLNWQHAAVAEVAGLRDREAQLTAEHAAVSSELSRLSCLV